MDTNFKLLTIRAKEGVYSLLSGNHLSKLYGDGYDFAELREYQVGDDVRKINWNISAKLQKPYIKEVNSNRELSIVVVSMLDGGLYFGEDNKKQHLMTEIASMLAYYTQYNNDIFSGINYAQNSIYTTNPTKQIFTIDSYLKDIYNTKTLYTKLDKQEAIKDLFRRVDKPSLIFVLSDFLDEVDLSTISQKHEIVAIIIRDEDEQNPTLKGEYNLISPISNDKKKRFINKSSIDRYKLKLKENDDKLIKHLSQNSIRYSQILTNDNILTKLMNL